MQRRAKIGLCQLIQSPTDELLVSCANAGRSDGQGIWRADALTAFGLELDQLRRALGHGHVAGWLVDLAASSQILKALLLDLDVEQDEGVQAKAGVLLEAVVHGGWFPGVGEEHHAGGPAEVVQLQTGGPDGR